MRKVILIFSFLILKIHLADSATRRRVASAGDHRGLPPAARPARPAGLPEAATALGNAGFEQRDRVASP